jgi:hypothetical protein
MGADYVQILRVTEPHLEGICAYKGFVIDDLAYKLVLGATSQAAPAPSAAFPQGLNGTYTGEIAGTAQAQDFAMRVTFTIVQTRDEIAGAWTTTGGTSGGVAGTRHRVQGQTTQSV